MNQENLAKLLDWLLSERLRAPSGDYATAAPKRVCRLLVWILKACRHRRGDPTGRPLDDAMLARIQALPPGVRDALRRYYVFSEADESIAFAMDLSLPEFHRMRAGARDFILGRRSAAHKVSSAPEHRVQ